jgi:hypothetical protein
VSTLSLSPHADTSAPAPGLARDLTRAALAGAVVALLIVASIESHALCELFCLHELLGAPMDTVLCTAAAQP